MHRKIVFLPAFIIFIFSASLASAQDQQVQWQSRTPEEKAKNQTNRMQKGLALTKEQYNKVYDINLYYANETDSLMKIPKSRDRRAEREGIERDKEAEMKNVLSPEQFKNYQLQLAEMKRKMEERRNMRQEGY